MYAEASTYTRENLNDFCFRVIHAKHSIFISSLDLFWIHHEFTSPKRIRERFQLEFTFFSCSCHQSQSGSARYLCSFVPLEGFELRGRRELHTVCKRDLMMGVMGNRREGRR